MIISEKIRKLFERTSLPEIELELILTFALKKTREFVLTHPERKINKKESAKIDALAKRRLSGEPIAYLAGEKEFFGFNFKVDKNVLVPRPETELMVERAIDIAKKEAAIFVDVGTGSGAIVVSLARWLKKNKLADGCHFFGIDISSSALLLARKNAKLNGAGKMIKFFRGNLLAGRKLPTEKKPLVILANLPYVPSGELKKLTEIKKEPRLALDGGADGLKYYRRLLEQLEKIASRFEKIYFLAEIDPKQAGTIKRVAAKCFPAARPEIIEDLSGRKRIFSFRHYEN